MHLLHRLKIDVALNWHYGRSQPGGIARAPHLDGDTARSQRLCWTAPRGYPSAKTRRPEDFVATSTAGKCPTNRCFSRSSTPSRAPEGPQSVGNRLTSTRLRSGTRARSPSPKSSKTPGRALTASRRRPTKTLEFASAAAVRGVEARPTHPLPRARVALRQNPALGAPGGENHLPGSPSGAAVVGRLLLHRNLIKGHPRHQGRALMTRMSFYQVTV